MKTIVIDFSIVLTLQLQVDFKNTSWALENKSKGAVCDANLNSQESGNLIDVTTQFWQKMSIKISGRLESHKIGQNTHHYNQWAEEKDIPVDDRVVDQINRLEVNPWKPAPGKMKALISCMKLGE